MADRIVLLETSAAMCSVALSEDGRVVSHRESSQVHAHASLTAVFVAEILNEKGLEVSDCQAVAVSSGPGSYTGLRVGSSTAKGLCFGAGIPLIAIPTVEILAAKAISQKLLPDGCTSIVPLIDARRNEVYTAVFGPDGSQRTNTQALVLTPDSFAELLSVGPVLFVGDGAEKCRRILSGKGAGTASEDSPLAASAFPKAVGAGTASEAVASTALEQSGFFACSPLASDMAALAQKRFAAGQFEDSAYFEPFYLKDFIATAPKHKLW